MRQRLRDYYSAIIHTVQTLGSSLRVTGGYLFRKVQRSSPVGIETAGYFAEAQGDITLAYPHQALPIPARGRYKLHNAIEDCIVCDRCAQICPVDCIDIVPIRSPVPIGKTSQGVPKQIYAATFTIDMAQCCFCGLCTTVCPTDCLTITPEYDFSTFDLIEHCVNFSTMTPEQIDEKTQIWAAHVAAVPTPP